MEGLRGHGRLSGEAAGRQPGLRAEHCGYKIGDILIGACVLLFLKTEFIFAFGSFKFLSVGNTTKNHRSRINSFQKTKKYID